MKRAARTGTTLQSQQHSVEAIRSAAQAGPRGNAEQKKTKTKTEKQKGSARDPDTKKDLPHADHRDPTPRQTKKNKTKRKIEKEDHKRRIQQRLTTARSSDHSCALEGTRAASARPRDRSFAQVQPPTFASCPRANTTKNAPPIHHTTPWMSGRKHGQTDTRAGSEGGLSRPLSPSGLLERIQQQRSIDARVPFLRVCTFAPPHHCRQSSHNEHCSRPFS